MGNEPIRTERSKQFAGKPPEPGEVIPGQENFGKHSAAPVFEDTDAPKPFVLVENTTAKLHGIGVKPKLPADGKEFTGITPTDPKVTLKPGVNKVDPTDWAEAKTQKMVQVHIDEGIFNELMGKDDAGNVRTSKSLSELSMADVNRVLPKTFDRKLLTEWQETDKRPPVVVLLKKQFELLAKQHRDVGESYQGQS